MEIIINYFMTTEREIYLKQVRKEEKKKITLTAFTKENYQPPLES